MPGGHERSFAENSGQTEFIQQDKDVLDLAFAFIEATAVDIGASRMPPGSVTIAEMTKAAEKAGRLYLDNDRQSMGCEENIA